MKIIFLGTGSSFPCPSRGTSSLILQLDSGKSWMFDAGEGTQIQIQKLPFNLSRKNIEKIFITHLHGDHLFGLPGLLCTLSMQLSSSISPDKIPILDIYGPLGLKSFLTTSLLISCSPLSFNYRVHELEPVECQFPKDWTSSSWNNDYSSSLHNHPNELVGEIIKPKKKDGYFQWNIEDDGYFTIQAGIIHHRVPTFGFIIKEKEKPGEFLLDKLRALRVTPGPLYRQLRNGCSITNESGEVIESVDVLSPPVAGKIIVICGDTSDASLLKPIIGNDGCDVLVHEATHDDSLAAKASEFGHSTPSQAAQMALQFGAKVLLLNHFSQRYSDEEGESCVSFLEEQARKVLENSTTSVYCARDFYVHQF